MKFSDLMKKRRTIRRYRQEKIARGILDGLVDCARNAPSAANNQPLEFVVIDEENLVEKTFPALKWAAYIAPRGVPPEGERPVAYVVVLVNREKNRWGAERDAGAAMENMILAALEEGIGSCWIGSVDREEVRRLLQVPEHLDIDSVLALGYPAESPVAEVLTDSVKYWKDENDVLHVPKRKMEDVIHHNRYRKKEGC